MKMKLSHFAASCVLLMSAGVGAAAFAPVGELPLLKSLDRGLWNFRAVGGGATGAATSKLCVGDALRLARIQHLDAQCTHYVVRSSPNSVTVSYSCKGQGQGLTTIRKESDRLIHIQSQGIRNNAPFSFSVEARHAGTC